MKTLGWSAAAAWARPGLSGSTAATDKRLNVLMIPVDDLRPELGCYGHSQVLSPHIDQLAATGTTFRRAYTMVATCSPSRTCLMTGCRPDTTQVYDLVTHFRKHLPDVVTLPQHFMKHGYETVGMGKVYHGSLNDLPSWSRWVEVESGPAWLDPKTQQWQARLRQEADEKGLKGAERDRHTRGTATECLDVPDNAYFDGAMTDVAVEELKRFAQSGQPFFLAVGYKKPHLPFIAPKRYWDLYRREDIRTAPNPFHPKNMPPGAVDAFPGEMGAYCDARELAAQQKAAGRQDWPADYAQQVIHAYYACISYIDAQIGRLLSTLEQTGLAAHTAVVLWGDHGWHLGENGTWGKHTNLEWATRSPLILRVPDQLATGAVASGLVEFVDVYPTLATICGLPIPAHCEGASLLPLIQQPSRRWKSAAFSQFRKNIDGVPCMGYTMRTDQFRYTEWRRRNDPAQVVARELYDHRRNRDENENLAGQAIHARLVEELAAQLKAGWQAARPG
ncbi:MAG: sulfatase [Planctomycetes bacterium]|nr:sulfatase [Planctomycetota bacterium]